MERIKTIETDAIRKIDEASTAESLEDIRVEYLGRKGKLTLLLREIGKMPPEKRREFGSESNRVRRIIEEKLSSKQSEIKKHADEAQREKLDLTLPGLRPEVGRIHPITQTIDAIVRIFERLGFEEVEGREVETEFYNFTALNIPLDHPSREAFDTFYTPCGNLLRSQTSTVQIRIMEERKPPLRIVAPGRVYRPDTVDASHSFMFHQIEGLMVDEKTTFSDLKGILHLFLRELFGKDTKMRFRPHYFPFTEPSVEVDISCFACKGEGCSTCGRTGWIEVLGAGTVDPAVFDHVGYNPKKVQGFAFGLGVERIAMLKHGIHDIRLFFDNDLRFLKQF